jgi:hypothetical protein
LIAVPSARDLLLVLARERGLAGRIGLWGSKTGRRLLICEYD